MRRIEFNIEILPGGTHAVWGYGVRFKSEAIPWKEIELEPGVFMLFAISEKSNRFAIHSIFRDEDKMAKVTN